MNGRKHTTFSPTANPEDPRLDGLQFGHGMGAVETVATTASRPPASTSFNSATAWEPWRPQEPGTWGTRCRRLQFGHGMGAVETLRQSMELLRKVTLQFGHGMGAVETHPARERFQSHEVELQFGHGMGAVETRAARMIGKPSTSIASIRPRHGSRGDVAAGGRYAPRSGRFNSATAWEPWRPR